MVGLSKNATLVARNIFPTNFLNEGSTKKMSCSHGSGVKKKKRVNNTMLHLFDKADGQHLSDFDATSHI